VDTELIRAAEPAVGTDERTPNPEKAEADALWAQIDRLERAPDVLDAAGTTLDSVGSFDTVAPGEVPLRGDGSGGVETLATPQRVSEKTSAGHFYIYNPRTGDRSITNGNQLRQQLTKRDPFDGGLMFVPKDPGIRPKTGTFRCLLHPKNPESARWLAMGLAACTKRGTFQNEAEAMRHLRRKHKSQWEIMEEVRKDTERSEDRQQSKVLSQALAALLERQAAPAPAAAEPIPQAVIVPAQSSSQPAAVVVEPPKNRGGRPKGSVNRR
jgi:hypothetical protein